MWAWSPPADQKLAALMETPMRALERSLKALDKYLSNQVEQRTTNATVTTLYTQSVPVNETIVVDGYVSARRTGGTAGAANDGAGYTVQFVAKNTAGTAALIGSGTVTTLGESQAGWNVTLSASGGDILVRVTGAIDNNITWAWHGKRLTVKD